MIRTPFQALLTTVDLLRAPPRSPSTFGGRRVAQADYLYGRATRATQPPAALVQAGRYLPVDLGQCEARRQTCRWAYLALMMAGRVLLP